MPGEYCPGACSVNVRGCKKVAGTAQRVLRNAWLFSALVILGDESRLQPVLRDVYDMLGQPFDECSVGSVGAEVAGLQAAAVPFACYMGWSISVTNLDAGSRARDPTSLLEDWAENS
jgi:hypothetical protein